MTRGRARRRRCGRPTTRAASSRRRRPRSPARRRPRLAAWLGVFGAPMVLLVAWCSASTCRRCSTTCLVGWFVGGFVYLVVHDASAGPRRPLGRRRASSEPRRRARSSVQRVSVSETVEVTGHLMDSGILSPRPRRHPRVRRRLRHRPLRRRPRRRRHRPRATITVTAEDDEALQRLLMRLQTRGVNQVDPGEAASTAADMDGVFPDGFYSTTNLPTRVRLGGRWYDVENPEMDCGLVVETDGDDPPVYTLPMSDVRAGMQRRHRRLRHPGARPAGRQERRGVRLHGVRRLLEKPQAVLVRQVADGMREAKAGRQEGAVGRRPRRRAHRRRAGDGGAGRGRASSTCSSPATRWPPTTSSPSLYGTSLGVDLAMGRGVEHGHEHHIRALNTIRKAGLDPGGRRAAAC